MLAILLAPLFVLVVSAIQITAPTNSSGWTTDGSQEIKWNSVSTDPTKLSIQVINPASPNSPQIVAQDVDTSKGSYIWTPTSALAAGAQWRVNVVGGQNSQQGILAQSDYFEVKQGQSTVSAPASSSTSSPSQTSTASSASSAATTSRNAAAGTLAAPTGLMLLLAGLMGGLA